MDNVPRRFARPKHRVALTLTPLLAATLAACETPVVRWVDAAPVVTSKPSPLEYPAFMPYDSLLVDGSPEAAFLLTQDQLREAGAATMLAGPLDSMTVARETIGAAATMASMQMAPAPTTSLGDGVVPTDSLRCARSLRIVDAPGRGQVAVWWQRAKNGQVRVVAAWRDSLPATGTLGVWRGPIMVDTLDQGPRDAQAAERGAYGCARPAPSIAVDGKNGYVHVAYALTGPEGPGVFYAHQMDPRAAFEPPVAILYGERLGEVRVASDGELVAVAYEDPNSRSRIAIGLAISRTAGHLFEERLTASGGTTGRDPHVVTRGRAVVVGWSDFSGADAAPSFRVRRAEVLK